MLGRRQIRILPIAVDQFVAKFLCAGRALLHRAQVKSLSRTTLRVACPVALEDDFVSEVVRMRRRG